MGFIEKNISLINPFVRERYFKNADRSSARAFAEGYVDFLNENQMAVSLLNEAILSNNVHALINERKDTDGLSSILESAGNLAAELDEIRRYSDEDLAEEDLLGDALVDDELVSHIVMNKKRNPDMTDVHFFVDTIYRALVKDHLNYAEYSELSLMDTSDVLDMDALFAFKKIPNMRFEPGLLTPKTWDTSHVRNTTGMFYNCDFNNDSIRKWNMHSVLKADFMFRGCTLSNPDIVADWHMRVKVPKLDSVYNANAEKEVKQNFDKMKRTGEKIKTLAQGRRNNENCILSYDEYVQAVNEGRFTDTMKNIGGKIKNVAKATVNAFKNGIGYIVSAGKIFSAITADYLQRISNKVPNVKILVGSGSIDIKDEGYYGKCTEQEKNNYIEFLKAFGSVSESLDVNEERTPVSLSGVEGIQEKSVEQIKKMIIRKYKALQFGKKSKVLCIWGAPGVGKTTAAKAVVELFNKDLDPDDIKNRKGCIIIDCANLPVDGFYIPDKPSEEVVNLGDGQTVTRKVTEDVPKSWLPMYKAPQKGLSDEEQREEIKKLDAMANMATVTVKETDEDGWTREVEYSSGGGGIIVFDELMRADPTILKQIMNIMLERKYLGYVLGSKWLMICTSNRPNDDSQIRRTYKTNAGAFADRCDSVHLTPDFEEWSKYLRSCDYDKEFVNFAISFIREKDPDGDDSRWHNIDPDEISENGRAFTISPRSWDMLCSDISILEKTEDISSLAKLLDEYHEDVKTSVYGHIGTALGFTFMTYLDNKIGELPDSSETTSVDLDSILNGTAAPIPNGDNKTVFNNFMKKLKIEMGIKYKESNPLLEKDATAIAKYCIKSFKKYMAINGSDFATQVFIYLIQFMMDTQKSSFEDLPADDLYDYFKEIGKTNTEINSTLAEWDKKQ